MTSVPMFANLKPFAGFGFLEWEYRIKIRLERKDCLEALVEKPEETSHFRKKLDRLGKRCQEKVIQNMMELCSLLDGVEALMKSVAPSRAGSRMQQYDDHDAPHEQEEPGVGAGDRSEDGATNGNHHDEEDEDEDVVPVATPRDKTVAAANGVSANRDAGGGNGVQVQRGNHRRAEPDTEDEEEQEGNNTNGGYWRSGVASRPSTPPMADNASDASSMLPPARPKSRHEMATSRYSNLSYWKARRVIFYKNGDPFFPGVEFRFKPGRDIVSLESLLDKLSLRMDLPRGARYIFSMDGDRKYRLDELEDSASYVVSSYKAFKVRN
ncbi:hypothetical protein JTB14_021376 [Gonioctena quinquepunctata]|nr:hypothetical protein JTB14_021376 [Gonioctena quinquepunctata]